MKKELWILKGSRYFGKVEYLIQMTLNNIFKFYKHPMIENTTQEKKKEISNDMPK